MNNLQIGSIQQLTQLDSDTEWAKAYLAGQQNAVNTLKRVEARQLTTLQLLELMVLCVAEIETRCDFNTAVNGADLEDIHGAVNGVLNQYKGDNP